MTLTTQCSTVPSGQIVRHSFILRSCTSYGEP